MFEFFSNTAYIPYVETSVMVYLEFVKHGWLFSILEMSSLSLEFVWLLALFMAFSVKLKWTLLPNIFPVKVCVDCNEITLLFFYHKLKLSEWL